MSIRMVDHYLALELCGAPRRGANLKLPADLIQPEADRLKAFIDALVFTPEDMSTPPGSLTSERPERPGGDD